MDLWVALAGFGVGIVVGLTGMGGGALMTPLLVLFFGVAPLSAVSSDLVASAVMKPFGGAEHLRRGTVDRGLVLWLCAGSVPAAFGGVLVARALGHGDSVQAVIQTALGAALLLAAAGLVVKAHIGRRDAMRQPSALEAPDRARHRVRVHVFPTILIGIVGGLVVGITSVGSGSLIVVALLAVYPALRANDLVGTDLVQAVPLVASAALAHLLFGDFRLNLALALIVGSVPGVLLGALLSSRAPGGLIRAALCVVLTASGLKLLGVGAVGVGIAIAVLIMIGAWLALAHRYAMRQPALADTDVP